MTSRTDASAPCELLPWDSEFFGQPIGKVTSETLDDEQAIRIDQWALREKVACLYFLAPSQCTRSIQAAKHAGFDLVDIRCTFEHTHLDSLTAKLHPQTLPEISIRPFQSDDLSCLQAIARTAHNDTRFFSDPHFPRARAEALYTKWIELECQGRAQQVLVATSLSNEATGYISCHFNSTNRTGQIGLAGVSSEFRGKGLGQALVLASLLWFASQHAKHVTVVTQGRNLAAQRLYQRTGFLIRNLQLWYHKWYLT